MFHNEPQIYKVTIYLVIFTKRFRVKHYKALYKCCILLLFIIIVCEESLVSDIGRGNINLIYDNYII